MKKTKWILVLVILLIAAPSYAKSQDANELKFRDIKKLLMNHNPTIQINKNIQKNLKDGINSIEDAKDDRDDLEDAIDDIEDAIDNLEDVVDRQDSLIMGLRQSLAPPMDGERPEEDPAPVEPGDPSEPSDATDPSDPTDQSGDEPVDGDGQGENGPGGQGGQPPIGNQPDPLVYETLMGTIMQVQGLYEMNIEMLKNNIEMMEDNLDEFEKLPGQIMELEKTILSLDMANETIILGAQNLYLNYNNMSRRMDEAVQNLENLENRIELMLVQEELGMVRSLDVDSAINQREQLKLAIQAMQAQLDNITGEINLMLNMDFDTSLKLVDSNISLNEDILGDLDYKDDLRKAKKNSYALKLKGFDHDIKDHNAWWAKRYGSRNDSRIADRDLDNVEIDQDQEAKNVELVFHRAYENLKNKESILENEKQIFEHEEELYNLLEIKYELGIISTIEFNQGQADYKTHNNSFITAEQNLFQAWLGYDALIRGINFQN